MSVGPRASGLSVEERAKLRATVLALPPLTDEQIDALHDALAAIRLASGGRADA